MPRYAFGPFELDPEARVLHREGEPVPLTAKTFDTLVVLVENRGRLVDKDELLARVWAGSVVEEANLTQAIFTVRKILGDNPRNHQYIATVAGRGYQFVAPVSEKSANGAPEHRLIQPPQTIRQSRRGLVIGMVALLTAVAAAGLLLWRIRSSAREHAPEILHVSRFTSYPGVETMPAF